MRPLKLSPAPNRLRRVLNRLPARPTCPCSFTASVKVPAKCVGPSVTIALVPKVCILDSKSKQVRA